MRHTRRLLSFGGAMMVAMALTTGCGGELTPEAEAVGELQSPVSANTMPIYESFKFVLQVGRDYLYSTSATEGPNAGYTSMGTPWRLWTYAVNGSFVPFYRCIRPTGQHLLTTSYTCEGAGTREGILGYIATSQAAAVSAGAEAVSPLARYNYSGHYYVAPVPNTYYLGTYEGVVGYVTTQ